MSNRSEMFGRLLKGAINSIATYEGKTAPIIEEELGAKMGLASTSLQRYKAGYLPPDPRTVEIIVEAAVQRAYLHREWLQRFLHAARYHQTAQLLDRLCPTTSARPRPQRVYQNLPAPTYSQFVMREEAFAEVLDGLSQRSAAVIVVGLGGNGKTSLAREVADRCIKKDDGAALFDAAIWISDKDRPGTTNLSTVLDEIARTLDYPGFTQFEHDEKRREVEQLLRHQRVLVCVDNYETITDGALLGWLLRMPEPSKTIITTREYRREFRRGGWTVELRGMSDSEAWALVDERLKVLRIEKMVSSKTQLDPLVAATGGNPKAIEMTLGLVKYEHRPLQQVVDDLYAARGKLFDDLFTRAWALLDEASRRVLLVMAFFPASARTDALSLTADVQGFAFDRAVERLADLALLDGQQVDLDSIPRYTMHPLARAFALAQLAEQPAFEQGARQRWCNWCKELVGQVGTCWNDLDRLRILDSEEEIVYAAICWSSEKRFDNTVIDIVNGVRYYYNVRGLWDRRISINRLQAAAAHQLGNAVQEVRALAELVTALSKQGSLKEADELVPQLLQASQSTPLPDGMKFTFQYTLATHWVAHRDIAKARGILEALLPLSQTLDGQANILNRRWLGLCLYQQGDLIGAREILEECTHDATRVNDQRSIIGNKTWLAKIDLDELRLEDAEEKLRSCEVTALNNKDRRRLSEIKPLLARLHKLRNDNPAACAALIEAIDLFERLGMRRELAEAREEFRRLGAGETSAP